MTDSQPVVPSIVQTPSYLPHACWWQFIHCSGYCRDSVGDALQHCRDHQRPWWQWTQPVQEATQHGEVPKRWSQSWTPPTWANHEHMHPRCYHPTQQMQGNHQNAHHQDQKITFLPQRGSRTVRHTSLPLLHLPMGQLPIPQPAQLYASPHAMQCGTSLALTGFHGNGLPLGRGLHSHKQQR